MMKKVEECKEEIRAVLQQGLEKGYITEGETEQALQFQEWSTLQPILDKAQGVHHATKEELKQAREASPLYRSQFTPSELEKLKVLAPEEYELLR